ncbi:MAG: protein-export chaperone SecB [Lachnospiraceae bacterium]|nr:protein-export chaperone SecB [Lachnospiraceae bacterium]
MKQIKKSGFQFSNPHIEKVLLQSNDDFEEEKYDGMPISYGVKIKEKEESSAIVELEISIGQEGETTPFYVELIVVSKFRWTDDVEAPADSLLKLNATTLLMSYARPIIAHLTADAGFKPFNIPFVDLRNDFAE